MKLSANTGRLRQRLRCPLVVLAGAACGVFGLTGVEQAEGQQLLSAVRTDAAPVIDGELNEAAWQKAPELGGFVQIKSGNKAATQPTSVRCLFDAQNLYVGVRCIQPRGTIKASAGQDGAVWNDDSIELFLVPHILSTALRGRDAGEQDFHLIINAAVTRFDEVGTGGPASWNGAWDVKTTTQDDAWNAEIKIPFAALYDGGQAPALFTSWSLQLGRTVAGTGENSTLFPTLGAFRHHADFGYLVFVATAVDEATVRWNLDKQQALTPRLERIGQQLSAIKPTPNSDFERVLRAQARTAADLKAEYGATAPQAYTPAVRANMLARLDALEKDIRSSQEKVVAQKAWQMGSRVAIAPHPAVRDSALIGPDFLPPLETIGQTLKTTVAAGEFQAASFVFWTPEAQSNVMVKVGDLEAEAEAAVPVGAKGTPARLSSDAVDVKWVKCWYQAGTGEVYRGAKVLTPELLLKNPDLVGVDYAKQENILLDYKRPGYYSVPGYPGDSTTLLPLRNVAAGTANQVWLTISVPKGTPAGTYRGTMQLLSNGKELTKLPLSISVLDFDLSPSMMEHNWYVESGWGQIDVPWQNPQRALAEVRDLARHGVTNVGLSENLKDLPRAVALMREGGLRNDKLYMLSWGVGASHLLDQAPEKTGEEAAEWVATAKSLGIDDIYLYLVDEARGDVLNAVRPSAEAIRMAGAKTWVARSDDFSPVPGEFIDLAVQAASLARKEVVDDIHRSGHKIMSYANPQGGMERPELYRRRYGLLLWQGNYDGAFCWHYYATFGASVMDRNPWEEFLDPVSRQCVMAYPTRTGVVDTIQWEGWREGVNDCRYMATLLLEIRTARMEKRAGPDVEAADAWVKALKAGGEAALKDLDGIRAQMIGHIQACRAAK